MNAPVSTLTRASGTILPVWEVIVKIGPSGSMADGTFGWDKIRSYYFDTREQAQTRAEAEQAAVPAALILVRRAT